MNLIDINKTLELASTASCLAMSHASVTRNVNVSVIRRRRRTCWAGRDGV